MRCVLGHLGAIAGVASSAGTAAQTAFTYDLPGMFTDISGLGPPLVTGQNATATTAVSVAVANSAFPTGTLNVCTNGHVGYGAPFAGSGPYPVPGSSLYDGRTAMAALWSEWVTVPGPVSGVFAAELVEGGVSTLVIQWNDMGRPISTPSSVTFQLKIFGGDRGPAGAAAQLIYRDVDTGNANSSFGRGATIGYQRDRTHGVMFGPSSRQTIANGTVLTLLSAGGPGYWVEQGDAPHLVWTAQSIGRLASEPLNRVMGAIGAGGDGEDVYKIQICDAAAFSAHTLNPATHYDTALFLFGPNGRGIAFNDDDPLSTTSHASRLSNQFLAGNGVYYLAVASWLRWPRGDFTGGFIWDENGPRRLERAPDGPGAAEPLSSWVFGTGAGNYHVDLTGACFLVDPAACYPNCDASSTPPVLNVLDFVCFTQRFAAADPYANCDGSSVFPILTVNDFVCFTQRFAAGCP